MFLTRKFVAATALVVSAVMTAPAPTFAFDTTTARSVENVVIRGLVTGETGAPLAGAQIELFRYGSGLLTTLTAETDGTFALSLPRSAETLYWVRAWAKGYETAQQVVVTGRETPWVSLSLKQVTGQVTGEVKDPANQPLAGARVELLRSGYGVAFETKTDALGRYSLADVPAGAGYQVRVQAPGYAPALAALDPVPAGGTATGRVTLAPYAGTIDGRVVDEVTGQAVAGARVLVERSDLGVVATAATSQGGLFAAGVPAGAAFRVVVTAPGYLPLQAGQVQLDNLGKASLTGEKQLKLSPAAATLSGRVLDEDGQPVAGLPVLLEQEGVGLVDQTQTTADGSFEWPAVTAGARYRVRVAAPEMTHRSDLRQWALAGTDWVQPAGGRVTSVTLNLRDGKPQDYGRGQIRGLITRPAGAPLAGATVELIQPGFDKVVATTTTAADGSYRFDDVKANLPDLTGLRPMPPGNSYVIRVSATGYHAAMSGPIAVTPKRESLADLALAPTHGVLVARVTNQAGTALDLAELRLHPAAGGEPLIAKTVDGVARMTAPVGQPYWLEVVRPGSHTAAVPTLTLSAEQDTPVDLVLQAEAGNLTGRVADFYQKPLAGVTVTARLADGKELTATTSADGSYRLDQVPAGAPLVLTAHLEGYTAAGSDQVITLKPGAEAHADLTLRAASGTVSGRVTGEGGPVAAGLEVQLWRSGQGLVDRTTTDANGLFAFAKVTADPDRSYEVRVVAPGAGVHQSGFRTPVPLFRLEPGKTVYLQFVVTSL